MAKSARRRPSIRFSQKLVLNQYFLSQFRGDGFDALAEHLKDETLEGRRDDGTTIFYHHLIDQLAPNGVIKNEHLVQYDENIRRHTDRINRRRSRPITWKYFQYLALLFTEHYLDRVFSGEDRFLKDINGFLKSFNAELIAKGQAKRDAITPFTPETLRKIAFWNATGSGKTLLLHINIHQYRHYLDKALASKQPGRAKPINRIIVLTPNERLTKQHVEELRASDFAAAEFRKDGDQLRTTDIDVIDMAKLREEGKKKTISVDAFETNNLVLIDEVHRGARGDVFTEMRRRLSEDGFRFEYSATLGQAAAGDKALTDEYVKSILFDYSYRYFYKDGFGKDFSILNMSSEAERARQEEKQRLYLTACLLTYYQQARYFIERGDELKAFLLDKPLWVFVGSKVNAVHTENKKKTSDVVDILLFIRDFIRDRAISLELIKTLLSGETGLLDAQNRDLFANAFPYLESNGETPEIIFSNILRIVFQSTAEGGLHIDRLTGGGEEELGLRVGDHSYFGVVSVGDAKSLADLCEANGLDVVKRDFSGSLFQSINTPESTINVLIGSKKFSEGWNSYRVSTMGLMRVGQTEGAEIIQLFGRGIRLRGFENSLKRSRAINWVAKDQEMRWVLDDPHIRRLETLFVFGVKADYMAKFRDVLDEEEVAGGDEFKRVSIKASEPLQPETPLNIIALPEDCNFKKERKVTFGRPSDHQTPLRQVSLDWHPRVEVKVAMGVDHGQRMEKPNEEKITEYHLAFLDWRAIYDELQSYKAEKRLYNMNMSRCDLKNIFSSSEWYRLYCPKDVFEIGDFRKIAEWTEIVVALLKRYVDRFYAMERANFEGPLRTYAPLRLAGPNFPEQYDFTVHERETSILNQLKAMRSNLDAVYQGDFAIHSAGESLVFSKHLYQPLIHFRESITSDVVSVTPTHLNKGEAQFVKDLRTYYERQPDELTAKEVYLLRNQSRSKGISFPEAGNFYPDFILWVIDGDNQTLIFIDPKGIKHCHGLNDPKIKLHETIKNIEESMRTTNLDIAQHIRLESFIVSVTPLGEVRWWGGDDNVDYDAFATEHHVLFLDEDEAYVRRLFTLAAA